MSGSSSQVIWKQAWSRDAERTLEQALASCHCAIEELPSQAWDSGTASIGGVRDYLVSYLAPAAAEWSSAMLHLNSLAGGPLAAELSRLIEGTAIVFFDYDQAAWGYCLYVDGELLDRFWNFPEIVDMPARECAGMPAEMGRVFNVSAWDIAPYLRQAACHEGKAFEEDEFALSCPWVRVDFMRRLGLSYPNPGQVAGGRYVRIYEPAQPG